MAERGRILDGDADVAAVLKDAQRIAVVGIKPDTHRQAASHYVPAYLQRAGFEIVPVPTYFPDATEILGETVYRRVADIPGDVDLVVLFRRSADVPAHVDDIIEKKPKAVWMQSGIRNPEAAERLADAGIDVVQDRCAMIEHRAG